MSSVILVENQLTSFTRWQTRKRGTKASREVSCEHSEGHVNTMQHLERTRDRGIGTERDQGRSVNNRWGLQKGHDGCVMATQSQRLRQSEIPRQVGGNTIHGIPSWRGSLQDRSQKIHNRHTQLYIYKFHRKNKIQYSYSISNMSVTFWRQLVLL